MFRLLLLLLLSSLSLWAQAHILVYHRFADPRYPSTNTSLKQLQKDFLYLQEHGYKVVPLSKLIKALRQHQPIDPRWVIITIDDGFKSFLKAFPIFRSFGYPFTIFINTEPIQKGYPDYLSWQDLKKIGKYGEIGFHSHSHAHLTDLDEHSIITDTQRGIDLFKNYLGYRPRSYAYPYGEYNEKIKKILKSLGFEAIANQQKGVATDPLDLSRIALTPHTTIQKALKIQGVKAQWIEPKNYSPDHLLRHIKVKIDPRYKKAQIYITNAGWQEVEVKDGLIDQNLSIKLTKRRVLMIIKVKNSKISTKLLVRSRYGAK
ncbi:MAG: polysaccharide deacetylase [Epsilonproteobacteria bacterium]|nr:polysaccharide deacetylase [Campylobacterota bacterium]NPA63989.1 polysaccharide deacetylase family protein [Campylobacterota bacterium]